MNYSIIDQNIVQDNDIPNWVTLSLEAGIFLPIAFGFAKHFFKKEEDGKKKKEREAKIELYFLTKFYDPLI